MAFFGSGIPNAYPIAIGAPLGDRFGGQLLPLPPEYLPDMTLADILNKLSEHLGYADPLQRAYLRPLKQPIYDTEMIDSTMQTVNFFKHPIGQTMAIGGAFTVKTETETNLYQSNQLSYPIEFSLLAFNFFIEDGIPASDVAELRNYGHLEFYFHGRRPYWGKPLLTMPRHEDYPNMAKLVQQTTQAKALLKAGRQQEYDDLVDEMRGMLRQNAKFNIGKSSFKIKPGESFGMKLTTGGRFLKLSRPIRVTAMIEGLYWTPL